MVCGFCLFWFRVFFAHLRTKCIRASSQALTRESLYLCRNVLNCMVTAKSIQGVVSYISAHMWKCGIFSTTGIIKAAVALQELLLSPLCHTLSTFGSKGIQLENKFNVCCIN